MITTPADRDKGTLHPDIASRQQYQQYQGSIPTRPGNYPLSKEEDPEHTKPVKRYHVQAKVFNLCDNDSDEDGNGIVAYNKVCQEVYDSRDGAEFVACEVRGPGDGSTTWTAFVQWRTQQILPPNMQGK